jgi:hypothetical protein
MRANKGLGRSAARNLRLQREAEEAAQVRVSPYHTRRVNKQMFRPSNRVSNVVVYEYEVRQLIENLGLRRVTASKRRMLCDSLYDQKFKIVVS